jgi:hypothetical protein
MVDIMERASIAVTGGLLIPVEVGAKVLWPSCLGDVREADDKGQDMWLEIMELLYGNLLAGRQSKA